MTRIKIESNPYNQEIAYYRSNENTREWVRLNYDDDGNSKLMSDNFVKGFFPFYVKEIVDEIIAEYMDDQGKIQIVFEGTDDEYLELASICTDDEYKDLVDICRSDKRLANARDILPSITQIFADHLSPLILKSIDEEKIDIELRKFTDASKDTVPICVLGNYSAGKSTFINALIGQEVLPSGDEPITAKIYQISRSLSDDRAYVELLYENEKFKINFKPDENDIVFTGVDRPLYRMIKEKLDALGKRKITDRVHDALEIINNFDKNDKPDAISNLISIQVPFTGGLWNLANRDFVIFDTPGSNSASNDKHLEVLKEQMHNLSNGLPIFVSEYDALDSTDNERLYRVIREVNELDSRFTMIIVNKADAARIPKTGFSELEIDQILAMAVPKNLYTEGIYFVSSIMGLGAKNDAEFIDEHLAEVFEGQESKYSNPSSRFYKTLYKNNIMPEQLKKRALERAEGQKDLLYANSGLYSVEDEILTFAEKYSQYNKCKQACLFLDKVIGNTSAEIEKTKASREEQHRQITSIFERDKQELIYRIESASKNMERVDKNYYAVYMEPYVLDAETVYTKSQLEEIEAEFLKRQREEKNYEERQVDVFRAKLNLRTNLRENIAKVIKSKGIDAIKELSSDLMEDIETVNQQDSVLNEVKHDVDKSASDELLDRIKNDFTMHIMGAQKKLQIASNAYWLDKSAEIRKELIAIVTGSPVLTDEKKAEIKDLILMYEDINLDSVAEKTFIRDDFEKGIWIGKIKIISSDRLDIQKLVQKYNKKMAELVEALSNTIRQTHEVGFDTWIANLVDKIIANVVVYNSVLQEQANTIREISKKIEDLQKRQIDLQTYTEQIRSMLDWSMV